MDDFETAVTSFLLANWQPIVYFVILIMLATGQLTWLHMVDEELKIYYPVPRRKKTDGRSS